jgi:hypothetical protein
MCCGDAVDNLLQRLMVDVTMAGVGKLLRCMERCFLNAHRVLMMLQGNRRLCTAVFEAPKGERGGIVMQRMQLLPDARTGMHCR